MHSSRIFIVLGPFLIKKGPSLVGDSGLLLLRGLQLTFKDNRNEQVEKDQGYDEHEADEVQVRIWCATSIDAISLLLFISLILSAFEQDGPLSRTVKHDLLPILSSNNSKKRQ